MKTLSCVTTFFLPVLLGQHVAGLQWLPSTPADGGRVYACANSEVSLLWNFTRQTGDIISSVVWNFRNGRSREMMVAMWAQGNFFATPSFSRRVRFVPSAGIVMNAVTVGDTGNFSVTVSGHDALGAVIETTRTVSLHVTDSLLTTDHELHAGQQSEAEISPVTHQLHAVLTCGVFVFPGDPPDINFVEWLTPDNHTLPSTVYSQGLYKLFLANPVTQGTYTCRISSSTRNRTCGNGGSQSADVEVDAVTTRLSLMEARVKMKDALIDKLTAQQTTLVADQHRLQADHRKLQDENANLTSQVQAMKEALQDINHHTSPNVAFSARLSRTHQQNAVNTPLVLDEVLVNEGDGYDNSSGMFTAPITATYYFSASVSSNHTDLYLTTDSAVGGGGGGQVFHFFTYTYVRTHYQSGSLQGALRLLKGEKTWLVSSDPVNYFAAGGYTTFSGFLLFV